jgi:hypothetical protein
VALTCTDATSRDVREGPPRSRKVTIFGHVRARKGTILKSEAVCRMDGDTFGWAAGRSSCAISVSLLQPATQASNALNKKVFARLGG